jgi:hypothetical protein
VRSIASIHDSQPAISEGASITPRLLLFEAVGSDRLQIRDEMHRSGLRADTILVESHAAAERLDRRSFDVAAIKLGGERCDELVFATDFARSAPWVQFVFWLPDGAPSLGAYIARALGIARLIPVSQLSRWLTAALVPLARLSRAQRAVLEAEATIPGVPPISFGSAAPALALPEAERQFRESYLRRLLSESPNAKKAAQRAGVPYTTLCSMMKKLGLSKTI